MLKAEAAATASRSQSAWRGATSTLSSRDEWYSDTLASDVNTAAVGGSVGSVRDAAGDDWDHGRSNGTHQASPPPLPQRLDAADANGAAATSPAESMVEAPRDVATLPTPTQAATSPRGAGNAVAAPRRTALAPLPPLDLSSRDLTVAEAEAAVGPRVAGGQHGDAAARFTTINLSSNVLDAVPSLPAWIIHLDVSDNQLRSLDGVQALRRLQVLRAASNQLVEVLPLAACAELRQLDVTGNAVESLAGLEPLRSLQEVRAADNLISHATALRPLALVTSLRVLDIAGNRVKRTMGDFMLRNLLPHVQVRLRVFMRVWLCVWLCVVSFVWWACLLTRRECWLQIIDGHRTSDPFQFGGVPTTKQGIRTGSYGGLCVWNRCCYCTLWLTPRDGIPQRYSTTPPNSADKPADDDPAPRRPPDLRCSATTPCKATSTAVVATPHRYTAGVWAAATCMMPTNATTTTTTATRDRTTGDQPRTAAPLHHLDMRVHLTAVATQVKPAVVLAVPTHRRVTVMRVLSRAWLPAVKPRSGPTATTTATATAVTTATRSVRKPRRRRVPRLWTRPIELHVRLRRRRRLRQPSWRRSTTRVTATNRTRSWLSLGWMLAWTWWARRLVMLEVLAARAVVMATAPPTRD